MRTYSSLKVERTILLGFLSFIMIGTLLIWAANYSGERQISLVDAMFTSTSAICVTGLVVIDTGKDLVPLSQAILLILIQLGGLGVMTAATTMLLLFRQRIGIRQRLLFVGSLGIDSPAGAVRLLMKILQITLIIEILGATPLFFSFNRDLPWIKALYYAVFHSVSSFCNAGFSPITSSLEMYSQDLVIPGTVMILIIMGGMGFLPIVNLIGFIRGKERLNIHSRLVLATTIILIALGTFLIGVTEWEHSLKNLAQGWKVWNALFQSVTPRTAGFDTVPISEFSSSGLLFLCILMIIGASPGSTGGGVKTTTFGVLILSSWNFLRGRRSTVIWNRSIHNENILRSLAIFVMYLGTILFATTFLSLLEPLPFRDIVFEVISALGTVGLSTGITMSLSTSGKLVLMVLMFWGRIGILTFIYGILSRESDTDISYAKANIPIG